MAEIVNLRMARKAKQRAGTAAANRAKFGQTKAEKSIQRDEAERAGRTLDGAKLERD